MGHSSEFLRRVSEGVPNHDQPGTHRAIPVPGELSASPKQLPDDWHAQTERFDRSQRRKAHAVDACFRQVLRQTVRTGVESEQQ